MRTISIILTLFTTLISWDCARNNDQFAPEKRYYFEVICGSPKVDCLQLKEYLEDKIPQYKYTITNESGKKWPFYKAYSIEEPVPSDSLMPPHEAVHYFIQKTENTIFKEGDFFVRFDIFPLPDTTTNFNVTIYKMDSSNLSLSATTGIEVEDNTRKDSTLTYYEAFLKTIIRYSFK